MPQSDTWNDTLAPALRRREPSTKDAARVFKDRSLEQIKRVRGGRVVGCIPAEYFVTAAKAYGWQFVREVLEPIIGPDSQKAQLDAHNETLGRILSALGEPSGLVRGDAVRAAGLDDDAER
jgi:hypothetical protein